MLVRLIQISRTVTILGLMSWATLLAAAETKPATTEAAAPAAQKQPADSDVRYADESSITTSGAPGLLVGVPTLAPRRPADQGTLKPIDQQPVPLQVQPREEVTTQPAKAAAPTETPSKGTAVKPDKVDKNGSLVPIPDTKYLGPAEVEATSFHGVTPGVTLREAVEKTWGKPKDSKKVDNALVQLYSVDPFPKVELTYAGEKVASLIIRFDRGFPASQVAEQLDLVKVQPVLVSNELGEVLGQAYPERGVLFSFEPATDPAKALKKVTHIILEPIAAEPFVLRAETNIDIRPEFSLHDADQAIKLQPNNARAHWLRSRAMTGLGRHEGAVAAAAEAVRLDPREARFQVTKAQTLLQTGHSADASAAALKAVELAPQRPHIKARALCLLGDIKAAGTQSDLKQALEYHTQALQLATTLTGSKHPAIRVAAKEVLLDAHLGGLHDISWGAWREKERSAENWLSKATELAQDLIHKEDGSEEYLFRLSAHALTASVGLQGKMDPSHWSKELVRSGEALVAAAPETERKAELQWQISLALYDAMQAYQMRGEESNAMKQGELAINFLEKSGRSGKVSSACYLLGRICFRAGALQAINHKDHQAAVKWFERAVPQLGKTPPPEAMTDLGRLGDSFVSMGVSYWNIGEKKKAVALTQHGVTLIEEAVRRGTTERKVLSIPYANLAAMNRETGDNRAAIELEAKAKEIKLR